MLENMRIVDEEGVLFEVQLDEVLANAKHETHCHFELICPTICLADGSRATGYNLKGGCVGHVFCAASKRFGANFSQAPQYKYRMPL